MGLEQNGCSFWPNGLLLAFTLVKGDAMHYSDVVRKLGMSYIPNHPTITGVTPEERKFLITNGFGYVVCVTREGDVHLLALRRRRCCDKGIEIFRGKGDDPEGWKNVTDHILNGLQT